MIVRAITLGLSLGWPPDLPSVRRASETLARFAEALASSGHTVQTTRLSLSPYYEVIPPQQAGALARVVEEVESELTAAGVGYVSFGPIRWRTLGSDVAQDYLDMLPSVIAASSASFFSVEIADAQGIRFPAVAGAARAVGEISRTTEAGFGNLRLAAIANCPPGIPFFPAGYHEGEEWSVGFALQTADEVAKAGAGEDGLAEALGRVSQRIRDLEQELAGIAAPIAERLGVRYAGVDRSPAPFPSDESSAAGMLERLGVGRFGEPGTLASAMLLTRALRAGGQGIGFSGLMLPLLEDSGLARRAGEGLYSWSELLLYSAVCGTGLDTVPLPGDVTDDELAGIILDVAALSTALQKPLTCRLFPVPGKQAGERTSFDFPYFANATVLSTKGAGPTRLLRRASLDSP